MVNTVKPDLSATRLNTDTKKSGGELNSKGQFMGAVLSLSWRLALVVLVPVIGGFKLDQHFNSAPFLTITGFIIAMIGSFLLVKKIFDDLNKNINAKAHK